VKPGPRKNLAASVRQRLLNLARLRREELLLLLTRFALERLAAPQRREPARFPES